MILQLTPQQRASCGLLDYLDTIARLLANYHTLRATQEDIVESLPVPFPSSKNQICVYGFKANPLAIFSFVI